MTSAEKPMKIPLGFIDDDLSSTPKYFAMQRQISKSSLTGDSVENIPQPVNVLMVGSGEYTTGTILPMG